MACGSDSALARLAQRSSWKQVVDASLDVGLGEPDMDLRLRSKGVGASAAECVLLSVVDIVDISERFAVGTIQTLQIQTIKKCFRIITPVCVQEVGGHDQQST